LGEVRDNINATYNFIAAVENIALGFSDLWRNKISNREKKGKIEIIPDGFKKAEHFRDFWRTHAATKLPKGTANSGAFSAGQSTQGGDNTPTQHGPKYHDSVSIPGIAEIRRF
jgi:hypothetical protein